MIIAALFVAEDGPYIGQQGIDAWTRTRDARTYAGQAPVVAHPPCGRWGAFATVGGRQVGDDEGCGGAAVTAVRRCGGVLEQPAGSKLFAAFGLPRPPARGWSPPDPYGGRSCYVDQGIYGHRAKKPTWLYAVLPTFPELDWTRVWGRPKVGRCDLYANARERAKARASSKYVRVPEVSRRERYLTPAPFRDLLVSLARSCIGWTPTPRQRQLAILEGAEPGASRVKPVAGAEPRGGA